MSDLKKAVEKRFGKKISYFRDCQELSKKIFSETNRSISASTLRRYFGLLPSKSKPSKYTVDTLQKYTGLNERSEKEELRSLTDSKSFETVIQEFNRITRFTISSVKNNSIIEFEKTISRNKIEEQLNDFLDIKKKATALIAKGGYGKSVALAHWVIKLSSLRKGILILFINAQNLNASNRFLNAKFYAEKAFTELIKKSGYKQIVLVIDAVDEFYSNPMKLLNFYQRIVDLVLALKNDLDIKIILSARETTWERFLLPHFNITNQDWWYNLELTDAFNKHQNIPYLSSDEIKLLIKNNIDDESINPIIFSDYEKLDLVKLPITISILFKLYKTRDLKNFSFNSLYKQLLDHLIFSTRFAEEKTDIVSKMIDLIDINGFNYMVKKNDLKAVYPIHMKSNVNYYMAYNELISYGFLSEYKLYNDYGFTTMYIQFSHISFYFYFAALLSISRHGKLDFDLIKVISKSTNNIEYLSNVIGCLYQMAYENENIEAIKDIYSLDDQILDSPDLKWYIGSSLRKQNGIQKRLIDFYAKEKKAHKYYFELFVDINNLTKYYFNAILNYSKFKDNIEGILFIKSLSFYNSFLTLDKQGCEEAFSQLRKLTPDESVFPWPVGRKIGYAILYNYYVKNADKLNFDVLRKYREIAYGGSDYSHSKDYIFEVTVAYCLHLSKQYELNIQFIKHYLNIVENDRKQHNMGLVLDTHHKPTLALFLEIAKYKVSGKIHQSTINNCLDYKNKIITNYDSYQYILTIQLFLIDYFVEKGQKEKALEVSTEALDLSKYAKYDFFTAMILKNWPVLSSEKMTLGDKMIKASGFNPDMF